MKKHPECDQNNPVELVEQFEVRLAIVHQTSVRVKDQEGSKHVGEAESEDVGGEHCVASLD